MAKPSGIRFIEGSNILEQLGIAPTVLRAPGCYCSFCGNAVDAKLAIRGSGQMRAKMEQEPIRDEFGKVIDHKEVLKWSSAKLIACNDCCLQLTEKYARDRQGGIKLNAQGDPIVVGNKVKWPEFD